MINQKTLKSALFNLLITLMFAIYNAYLGLSSFSWWYITLCGYYIILTVMRIAVVLSERKHSKNAVDEMFIMRFVGIMLIVLSVILAGINTLSAINDRSSKHGEIVMITIAAYTTYKVTIAIINMAKSKNVNSPLLKTLRNISLADALVSIVSMQRSMLISFDGMTQSDIKLMNILTGSAVYVVVCILGINLIGGKKVTMAKSKIAKANEKIAQAVTDGYKKIETGVVDGFKKIEDGVVEGYTKIEDKFVDMYLTHDGETVEEAKKRLKNKKD